MLNHAFLSEKKQQLHVVGKSKQKLTVPLVIILLLCLLGFSYSLISKVFAQTGSTTVGAILCDTQGPDLQITAPVSDTSTSSQVISIQGMAYRTSQIDIYLNNVYDHSVAIGFDAVLQTPVSLIEGTNTIKLQAFFSCNGTSSDSTLIIRYQPEVVPVPIEPTTVVTGLGDQSGVSKRGNSNYSQQDSTVGEIIQRIKDKLNISEDSDKFSPDTDKSYVKKSFHLPTFLAIVALLSLFAYSVVVIFNFIQNGVLSFGIVFKRKHVFTKLIILMVIFLAALFFAV